MLKHPNVFIPVTCHTDKQKCVKLKQRKDKTVSGFSDLVGSSKPKVNGKWQITNRHHNLNLLFVCVYICVCLCRLCGQRCVWGPCHSGGGGGAGGRGVRLVHIQSPLFLHILPWLHLNLYLHPQSVYLFAGQKKEFWFWFWFRSASTVANLSSTLYAMDSLHASIRLRGEILKGNCWHESQEKQKRQFSRDKLLRKKTVCCWEHNLRDKRRSMSYSVVGKMLNLGGLSSETWSEPEPEQFTAIICYLVRLSSDHHDPEQPQ